MRVPPPYEQDRPWPPRHPVSQAYDIRRRYSVPGDGSHSGDPGRSWPIHGPSASIERDEERAHIHNIVKHNKCGATSLLLVADTNLTNAAVSSKEIIQVLACYLVVQVLYEQDSVGTWRQLSLYTVDMSSIIV